MFGSAAHLQFISIAWLNHKPLSPPFLRGYTSFCSKQWSLSSQLDA